MDTFFEKISSYNIVNYMLPGAIFSMLSENWLGYNIVNENMLLALFTVYFVGLIISRIGSIAIEPLLLKIKFIKFVPYHDYVKQERKDQKIKILNEHNNMFRTLLTMMILLILLKAYQFLSVKLCFSQYDNIVLIIGLLVLFLFSYRKQTLYINKRVNIND